MVSSSLYFFGLVLHLHDARSAAIPKLDDAPNDTPSMPSTPSATDDANSNRARPPLKLRTSGATESSSRIDRPYRPGFQCRRTRRATPNTPSSANASCRTPRSACLSGISPTLASAYRAALTPTITKSSTPSTIRSLRSFIPLQNTPKSPRAVSESDTNQAPPQVAPGLLDRLAEVAASASKILHSGSDKALPTAVTSKGALGVLESALPANSIGTSNVRNAFKEVAADLASSASKAAKATEAPPTRSSRSTEATSKPSASQSPSKTKSNRSRPSSTAQSSATASSQAKSVPTAMPSAASTKQPTGQDVQQKDRPKMQQQPQQPYRRTVAIALGVALPGSAILFLAGALYYYRRRHGQFFPSSSWSLSYLRPHKASTSSSLFSSPFSTPSPPSSGSVTPSLKATPAPLRGLASIVTHKPVFTHPTTPRAAHTAFSTLAPIKRRSHRRQTSSTASIHHHDQQHHYSRDVSPNSPALPDDKCLFTGGDVSGFDFHCAGDSPVRGNDILLSPISAWGPATAQRVGGPLSPISPNTKASRVHWWDSNDATQSQMQLSPHALTTPFSAPVPAPAPAPIVPFAAARSYPPRSSSRNFRPLKRNQQPLPPAPRPSLSVVIDANHDLSLLAAAATASRQGSYSVVDSAEEEESARQDEEDEEEERYAHRSWEIEEREMVREADLVAAALRAASTVSLASPGAVARDERNHGDEEHDGEEQRSPQEMLLGRMWAPVSPGIWW